MEKQKRIPKRRFREFLEAGEWEEKTVKEVAPLQRGFDLPINLMKDGNYPVIASNGIIGYHNQYKAKGPGVVTGRSGTIGNLHYVEKDYWPHNTSLWVTDFKGNWAEFVYYLYTKLDLSKFGTGSGVPTLNRNDVHDTYVFAPSLPEQQHVSNFCRRLDTLISLHQQKLSKLKNLKQAYLTEMFPAPGEKRPRRRFKGFSGDWEEIYLTDEVSFYSGLTYVPTNIRKQGTLVLRSSNVVNGEVQTSDDVYVTDKCVNSPNVEKGDIIVVVRNGSKALIGKHAQIKQEMPHTVIGAFMTGIRSEEPAFINALLSTSCFDEEIRKNMGATINQITLGMFGQMKFMFPVEFGEKNAIGRFFATMDNKLATEENIISKLQSLKQAYLSELFV